MRYSSFDPYGPKTYGENLGVNSLPVIWPPCSTTGVSEHLEQAKRWVKLQQQ